MIIDTEDSGGKMNGVMHRSPSVCESKKESVASILFENAILLHPVKTS